ncbi:type 1 glutamine amidotransferase domain-containing protein [Streptosporangium sp. NPDC001559]|uniref:type 1 glutamine amidotransferase domain-containing protein n=1 Tax=Streptosporangium sp. NPDC001559 TaxID=3366187 RepID=UPI0036E7F778
MSATKRILVVVTNVGEYEKAGMRTGLWLGELTHFWDYAERAGFSLDIASPSGGTIPIDPESLAHDVLAELGTERRYRDRRFMNLLDDTRKVADVDVEDYDAIYLTGGHGVMFDFPRSDDLESLVAGFHESGRVVSAVCHGPCGLLNVTLSNGEPLVRGRDVTGFSWPEEEAADREDAVPYSLQEELKLLGAHYIAGRPFEAHVVEDDRLITGQNPGSARGVAEAVVRRLQPA